MVYWMAAQWHDSGYVAQTPVEGGQGGVLGGGLVVVLGSMFGAAVDIVFFFLWFGPWFWYGCRLLDEKLLVVVGLFVDECYLKRNSFSWLIR